PPVGAALFATPGRAWVLLGMPLFSLPLIFFRGRAPSGPRSQKAPPPPRPVRGLADIVSIIADVRGNTVIVSMTLLSGAAAMLISHAYQAQMPSYAQDLGHGTAGLFYGLLLAADAAGALTAGIVLEGSGWLLPRPNSAFVLVMIWCGVLAVFALTTSYPLALIMLFAAGFVELSYNSMTQTLVQLNAPNAIRGRVLGLYSAG